MIKIQLRETDFRDDIQFHKACATAMGFPEFYGKNWNAWIDCMSCIDSPKDEMSKVTVAPNESLEIEILIKDGNSYYKTPTWAAFTGCVAAVNGRFEGRGSATRLTVAEKSAG